MNLMTLVRLMGMLVIGWTMIAFGAGVLGVGANDVAGGTFYVARPSSQDVVMTGQPDGLASEQYALLDRVTGRTEPLALPEDENWSLLSVRPWRDRDGNVQAAGRWAKRITDQESMWGLGVLKLPGSTVVSRLPLDILPTSKVCWVPDHPGEVLFAAADGQLYRCNVVADAGEGTAADCNSTARDGNVAQPRPLAWQRKPAGSGVSYIADPALSSEPALRHVIFAALSTQKLQGDGPVSIPSKLWWLMVDGDGDSIKAAGQLSQPGSAGAASDEACERMPSVVVGPAGKMSLVYLTRKNGEESWKLRLAQLEVDPANSLPHLKQGRGGSTVVAGGLALASIVVSADGKTVYGREVGGGLCKRTIPQ
jgi:hypothetical protein